MLNTLIGAWNRKIMLSAILALVTILPMPSVAFAGGKNIKMYTPSDTGVVGRVWEGTYTAGIYYGSTYQEDLNAATIPNSPMVPFLMPATTNGTYWTTTPYNIYLHHECLYATPRLGRTLRGEAAKSSYWSWDDSMCVPAPIVP